MGRPNDRHEDSGGPQKSFLHVTGTIFLQRAALDDWAELRYSIGLGIELVGYLLLPNGQGDREKYRNNPRSPAYGTGAGFINAVIVSGKGRW